MGSVAQSWLSELSMKMQTVLFSALRGCDGVSDEDPSKAVSKFVRSAILLNAASPKSTFMKYDVKKICSFIADIHAYPIHYVTHEMHAMEIIGYFHPNLDTRSAAYFIYEAMVDALHTNVEFKEDLVHRLRDGVDSKNHKTEASSLEERLTRLREN